jgi:predicted aspartyl protease
MEIAAAVSYVLYRLSDRVPEMGEWGMPKHLLICVLLYTASSAAPALGNAPPTGNKPLAEISYRAGGKLIYMPVQVNGSRSHWFIFDTGAPYSIIDTAAAEKLNVKALSSNIIHGAGKGEVPAGDAGEVQLTAGGLATRVTHAKIVDLSKVPVPIKVEGILGAEFLEQYVVRIDPTQHKIAFYDPNQFVYRGDGKSMPLELTNSRVYVRVSLATRSGELSEGCESIPVPRIPLMMTLSGIHRPQKGLRSAMD